MQTKSLIERIAELEGIAACYGHNELGEAVDIAKQALRDLEVAQEQIKALRETDKEACQYMIKKKAENQALLAKNGELENNLVVTELRLKILQDERDRYKISWQADSEGSKAIIAELEEQIRILKGKLLKLRENKDDK